MALSLKDKETDSLARQVASLTGETLTEAVRTSLSERLRRERLKRGKAPSPKDELQAIFRRLDALPDLDARSADEIIGYDENGLPT
ncbi:type II toxin-antitoxin system VapB family antitoxin [Lichenicoccus sp.]|uniref:type II toxin-antitoxin system VapB family antitoxin n=1 Tax=Lichenicoccus sp. TaxID=2781899 RepID=UPI003D0AEA28